MSTRKAKVLAASSIFAATLLAACAGSAPAKGPDGVAGSSIPLFEGLGDHTRTVATTSREAQRYFDQGLAFLYGFNHDEARRAFRRAAELDPACAMAHWGEAMTNGPHINNPTVPEERARAGHAAARRALQHASAARPADRALIEAVGARFADPPPADRAPLDQAFADAMGRAWREHPDDADVGALYAEALMDLHPWNLWQADGSPHPWTPQIVETLETVMTKAPNHPLALHLYIHAVEASPDPARADAAADRLRDLNPGLGHMVHMPSHIDVRRGRWKEATVANTKAIEADRRYREIVPAQDFYRLYMAHNGHMLAYAAMMRGQSELALAAIRKMVAGIPQDWLAQNPFADGFVAMPLEVLIRFGRWDEILAEPELPDYVPISRALRRQARGIAYAAQGKLAEAQAEQRAFGEARGKVPEGATFGNNQAADILNVAEHMLAGELLLRAGKVDEGLAELRVAVELEDKLVYDEPPDWILPVRHALGAALLQAGKAVEAETVYRADLDKLPENGWSLYGLGRSLRAQGKAAEAAEFEARFDELWADADVKLTSSCFCQPGV